MQLRILLHKDETVVCMMLSCCRLVATLSLLCFFSSHLTALHCITFQTAPLLSNHPIPSHIPSPQDSPLYLSIHHPVVASYLGMPVGCCMYPPLPLMFAGVWCATSHCQAGREQSRAERENNQHQAHNRQHGQHTWPVSDCSRSTHAPLGCMM